MVDGTLLFDTGIDNSGFKSGVNSLQVAAGTALGNIAATMIGKISEIAAEIPAQVISIGSGFEASMSQVAATMGITSATEEFEILSAAAKEMGETTKFSASQAGEALNYLALAGYDAEKAVSALPTVLNVAAAGGMQLAEASDMITDAMSALGLATEEMSVFADKLAVTAQKSNTSVAQLGQAILTVGGTAKQLAGGVTEMNTVLGILADNGIKGAEGGTALRNVILSLTAPTSTAAKAIDSLGLSVFDNQGKMRSLQDIIYDLNDALGTMTDAEKSQALSDIFNKVDLKAINALLGTSAERFDELSGYIDNCSDAASDMAKTMDDNLKGDLTIMQSALEGLGIAAYEKFQTPLRNAVQAVTNDIGTLTSSMTNGELSESFNKVADGFSELVTSASDVLANNVIPDLINGMGTIIDYGESIIGIATGIGIAVAGIKLVPLIVSATTAMQTATVQVALLAAGSGTAAVAQTALAGGLSMAEIAAGVFTGKITLATAAQSLFNAAVASGTLTIIASTAALTALAAVTIGAALAFKNYVDNMETAAAVDPWLEQSQKRVSAAKAEQQAMADIIATQNEKNAADEAEAKNINRLWSELQNYVDENGKVISNNERAAEIIGTLNSAYGMNIGYIDGQIQGYGELAGSMDNYIERLRLEAKIRNGQDAYDEAIRKQEENNNKRLELEKQLQDKLAAFQAADNNDVKYVFATQIAGLREEIAALDDAAEMYQETIDNYESLFSGNSPSDSSWGSYFKKQTEWLVEARQDAAEEVELTNEEIIEKLSEGWKAAEHNYAMGIIGSEEELYAKKQQLLDEYGNAELEEHWQYYEDLYGYQQDYADRSKQLYEQQLNDEWLAIEHNNSLCLLSDEEAYKKKLAFIQKYCPEYSDEWYDYYKDISDYQKNAMQEQVDVFKSGLNTIKNEYKDAYNEINSKIEAYKQKLLSVGSVLEVIQNDDGSKTLKVNDLREQMAEMRKYASYVKQLKEQGASEGLLSELTSMDFKDGSEFAKNLAKMSSEDFAQINDYYKEKEALAQELATDLYQPELDNLNNTLASGILAQFGALPQEIQAAGAEAITAFIEGLNNGDMTTQVEEFCNDFVDACNEGIKNGFDTADFSDSFDQLYEQDTYSIGKSLGDDFAEGFNAALAEMQAAVAVEQAAVSAEYTARKHSGNQNTAGTPSASERIVIENKTTVELDVDGEKLAEKVIEKTDIINQRKGV